MVKLKIGDRVDCCLKSNTIVNPYLSDHDEIKTFEIIAKDKSGYYLFVPSYIFIKNSIKADKYLCKKIGASLKYIDDEVVYIGEGLIYKINYVMDGCLCSRCGEFYYMASPNQLDGTLVCWGCRDNPYR
jgi:hypothetical protein